MSISDIEQNKNHAMKTSFVYLLISVFCMIFGAIYEVFSHEVYSFYMIYAFAFPLVGGTLPFFILILTNAKAYPNTLSRNLYHSGIATLTVGSIIKGVLDIYGTTNSLAKYYRIVGFLLVVAGIAVFAAATIFSGTNEKG